MVDISFAICVHNEGPDIHNLLDRLTLFIDTDAPSGIQYEIVVVDDFSTDQYTIDTLAKFKDRIKLSQHALDGDFANHKNYMNSQCSGEWILNLDADEYVSDDVLAFLPHLIADNPEIEAYWFPRINKVDGLTMKHVQKWLWTISKFENHRTVKEMNPRSPEYKLLKDFDLIIGEDVFTNMKDRSTIVRYYDPIIAWPDYQMRLYKNKPEIVWTRPVHERLTGFTKFGHLPQDPDFAIHHYKTIDRQEKQNDYYDTLI